MNRRDLITGTAAATVAATVGIEPTSAAPVPPEIVTRYVCEYGDTSFFGLRREIGIIEITGRFYEDSSWGDDRYRFERIADDAGILKSYPANSVYADHASALVEYNRVSSALIEKYTARIQNLTKGALLPTIDGDWS